MATLRAISTGIYLDERMWCEELEQFSLDQLQSADMLVFGRVTYEGMAALRVASFFATRAMGGMNDLA